MRILLGDVVWINENGMMFDMIIERKTIEDLSSSVMDGWYKDQISWL